MEEACRPQPSLVKQIPLIQRSRFAYSMYVLTSLCSLEKPHQVSTVKATILVLRNKRRLASYVIAWPPGYLFHVSFNIIGTIRKASSGLLSQGSHPCSLIWAVDIEKENGWFHSLATGVRAM